MTTFTIPSINYREYGYPQPFYAELFPDFPQSLLPAISTNQAVRYYVRSSNIDQGPTDWALTIERPFKQAMRIARTSPYNQPLSTCYVNGELQVNPFEYSLVPVAGQPTWVGLATPVWNNARDPNNNSVLNYCERSSARTIWHVLIPQFAEYTIINGVPFTVNTSERVYP